MSLTCLELTERSACLCLQALGLKVCTTMPQAFKKILSSYFSFFSYCAICGSYFPFSNLSLKMPPFLKHSMSSISPHLLFW
ncbi:hypothetical protein I79_023714 [Cricetulus griseus]|uniref:Uncharacterized protein n=1 Tax=Cricetulus griseus TaxID=10029 RepID=G3IIP1_CRIGR|nr:hypothetical protein I79_023714 [Cricetulus griseus]